MALTGWHTGTVYDKHIITQLVDITKHSTIYNIGSFEVNRTTYSLTWYLAKSVVYFQPAKWPPTAPKGQF